MHAPSERATRQRTYARERTRGNTSKQTSVTCANRQITWSIRFCILDLDFLFLGGSAGERASRICVRMYVRVLGCGCMREYVV